LVAPIDVSGADGVSDVEELEGINVVEDGGRTEVEAVVVDASDVAGGVDVVVVVVGGGSGGVYGGIDGAVSCAVVLASSFGLVQACSRMPAKMATCRRPMMVTVQ